MLRRKVNPCGDLTGKRSTLFKVEELINGIDLISTFGWLIGLSLCPFVQLLVLVSTTVMG